jgi:molecular chaperone GrpE
VPKKRKSAPKVETDEVRESPPGNEAAEAAEADAAADGDTAPVDVGESPQPEGEDKTADVEEPAARHLSRERLLSMMASKNEVNARLTKEKEQLEAQIGELTDRWMRGVAEFENYRRRTRKEWELLKQQTRAEVIVEILSIVDDFERAFTSVEEGESSGYVEGFRLIYNNLVQTLNRLGVTELDALEQPFDPNFHMAVGQVERDDLDSGVVAEVVQKGYLLDDVVIRPANVLVAK